MTAAGTKTGKKESPETSDRACPPLPGCYLVFPALRSGDIREHWPRRWGSVLAVGANRPRWARSVAHRRVRHELADLLSTAAGGRDLRGPLQRCLPRGHVEDREPSVELLGLRVSASGDRPVTGHHDGIDVLG